VQGRKAEELSYGNLDAVERARYWRRGSANGAAQGQAQEKGGQADIASQLLDSQGKDKQGNSIDGVFEANDKGQGKGNGGVQVIEIKETIIQQINGGSAKKTLTEGVWANATSTPGAAMPPEYKVTAAPSNKTAAATPPAVEMPPAVVTPPPMAEVPPPEAKIPPKADMPPPEAMPPPPKANTTAPPALNSKNATVCVLFT
jgi:hypothetical protein